MVNCTSVTYQGTRRHVALQIHKRTMTHQHICRLVAIEEGTESQGAVVVER